MHDHEKEPIGHALHVLDTTMRRYIDTYSHKKEHENLTGTNTWVIQFIGKMAELIAGNVQDSSPVESASLADLERDAIRDALARLGKCTGRAAKAAKLLGISRATMYRKIQEYKIKIP